MAKDRDYWLTNVNPVFLRCSHKKKCFSFLGESMKENKNKNHSNAHKIMFFKLTG